MGGKFINTNRQDMIDRATNSLIDRLDNKYKVMLQEKGTNLIWFNKNIHSSTLDEASGLEYEPIGKNSPTRFNKVNNLLAYGLEKIAIQLEAGDYGVAASEISGELVLLPDTIIPYIGDYFMIPYIKEQYLFIITDVQFDTLANDSNYYKATYKLSDQDHKLPTLMDQVDDSYNIIIDNIGTNLKTIIKSDTYDLIDSEALYINLYECYASHLETHIDYLRGLKILDIGCGTGIHTQLISSYAKESIVTLQKSGLLHGMGDGSFSPNLASTRAEAAMVIYQAIKLL
jgi:hypothetical protein